jgi:hypothetical protein
MTLSLSLNSKLEQNSNHANYRDGNYILHNFGNYAWSQNLVIPTINYLHLVFSNHILNDQSFSFLFL